MQAPFSTSTRYFRFPERLIEAQDAAKLFIATVVFVTFYPYIAVPLHHFYPMEKTTLRDFYETLIYVQAIHICFSAYIYLDSDAKLLRQSQFIRFYIIAPLVVPCIFLINYVSHKFVQELLFYGFVVWLFWHFQKQHFGVLTFMRKAYTMAPLDKKGRMVAIYSALPAMLLFPALLIHADTNTVYLALSMHAEQVIRGLGIVASVVFGIIALCMAYKKYKAGEPILPTMFFFFLSINNLPLFIVNNAPLVMLAVTAGHGIQYALFMMVIAAVSTRTSSDRWRMIHLYKLLFRMIMLFGVAILLFTGRGMIIEHGILGFTNELTNNAFKSIAYSLTIVHFIIDGQM